MCIRSGGKASTLWLAVSFVAAGATVTAAEITLKDGTVLRGSVETPVILRGDKEATVGFIRVDDGLRRILFHAKQLQHVEDKTPLTSFKPFRISQPLHGRNPNLVVGHIVSIVGISPFDEYGRRTFSVKDARGQTDIPQGITEINPEYIKVQSLKHMWESSVATSSVPPATVEAILRKAIDPKNVDDRFRLVRFFLETEWFVQAGNELKAIEQEFPNVADQAREAADLLEKQKLRRRLREIKLRRAAGQHSMADQLLRTFPLEKAPGDVVAEVGELSKQYDGISQRLRQVQGAMEKLREEIKDGELRTKMDPAIEEILKSLHVESVGRLDNFLTLVDKADLAAEDKLAAAISGWVLGGAFAEPTTDRALALWNARDKITQYLGEHSEIRRQRLVAELKGQEAISVDLAAHAVEHLPPLQPTAGLDPDKPTKLAVASLADRNIDYWVLLPPEYNPYRHYPVIITLHGKGVSPETQLSWWSSPPGFQASRHGYIVVAPEYVVERKDYEYDTAAHDAVLYTLIDVRRRFSVDSDRVFLTGHSMGGDAAWDIGLAHPDLFAGVIPVCGSPQKFAEFYWQNAENTAFYIVEGEKDGLNPEQNTKVMRRMMENGHDVTYVEFKGRGHENFSDEILRLFDWMGRKTRRKFPLTFSCRSARQTDNEFFFVSVDDFAPAVLMDPYEFDRKKIRLAQIEGKIVGVANSIQLSITGPKQADLWIGPGMVDLTQPVTVRVNGQKSNRKMLTLDLEALLEDFRVRADRQKLFYAKMSFPRL